MQEIFPGALPAGTKDVRTKTKLDQKRNAKPNEHGTMERVEQKQTPPGAVFRTFKQ
jgi:hypothetical protein